MEQLEEAVARLNTRNLAPPLIPGYDSPFGTGPIGSGDPELSKVEFPSDGTSLEHLDIIQMGKDTFELSGKLYKLSRIMLTPYLQSTETGLPKNYTLTPDEVFLYTRTYVAIFLKPMEKSVTTYQTFQIMLSLKQAFMDEAGRASAETPHITYQRRRDMYHLVWSLIEIKILTVQSDWVLFMELQRRRQIARQEWELVEMQATGAEWRCKMLRIWTDFCDRYPHFRTLFTDKLSGKGLLKLTPDFADLLPTIRGNGKDQPVDLRLQKWKEEDRSCAICACGLFEGGADEYGVIEPVIAACRKCHQPLHLECLLEWARYEQPHLGLSKCPLCRTPMTKLLEINLLRLKTKRMHQIAERLEI